jgi:hypothetical protein
MITSACTQRVLSEYGPRMLEALRLRHDHTRAAAGTILPVDTAPPAVLQLAMELLNVAHVDPECSILQNGASSIVAAKFAAHFVGGSQCVFLPLKQLVLTAGAAAARTSVSSPAAAMTDAAFRALVDADCSLELGAFESKRETHTRTHTHMATQIDMSITASSLSQLLAGTLTACC